MTSKLKTDVLETVSGSGTIALTNQLSGMTSASVPLLTEAHVPAGSVIAVYHQSLGTGSIATTSTSFVDTGLSITLTPASTGSRFYISYSHSPHMNSGSSSSFSQNFVYRDGTRTTIGGGVRFVSTSGWRTFSQTTTGVDSPNTVSAVTYKVKMNSGDANGLFHVGSHLDGNDSPGTNTTFTIMEIKG